jgi:hypothetical protein
LGHDLLVSAGEGDTAGEFGLGFGVFLRDDGTAVAAFEEAFFGVETESAFGLLGAMASDAVGFEDGFDLLFEIDPCVGG